MMSAECIDIVVCADDGFALGAWMTIWSTWSACPDRKRLKFHLLTTTPNGTAIQKLIGLAQSFDIRLSVPAVGHSRLLNLPRSERLPLSIYLRLLAPQAISEVHRFLYLDSDVLVRSNILDLMDHVNWGFTISGCRDYSLGNAGRRFGSRCAEMGLDADSPYVNSGVLAVESERWRERGVTESILRYVEDFRDSIVHPDQDAINAVLSSDCGEMDAAWNVQVGALDFFDRMGWPSDRQTLFSRRGELLNSAKIVHFIGAVKPWNDGLFMAYGHEYRNLMIESGWIPRRAALLWKAASHYRAIAGGVRRRLCRQ